MPPGSEPPLLAHDRASDQSVDVEEGLEEEDALLTGQTREPEHKYGWKFWRQVGLLVWAILATIAAVVLGVLFQHEQMSTGSTRQSVPEGKRNLIFMVSDGMGPASLSLTRSFRQTLLDLPFNDSLALDDKLIGSSRTRSTSSLITDSAAGATAFSCGAKTYNTAISVLPDHTPCGTVLEAAKKAGYLTGLVVTTRLTDATPACFASHVQLREYEDNVAEQEVGLTHPLGNVVDLLFGGGRCHFLPNSTTSDRSCRKDDKDVVALAQKEKGWTYISTPQELDNVKLESPDLPLLGLFAPTDIPYEIDRRHADANTTYPSLAQMARVALDLLGSATKDSEQGFFLMIEGSRIDHTGHSNDPAAQVHQVMSYDDTFSSVLDFLSEEDQNNGVPSVVVGTSDHETGGLALARQLEGHDPIYEWCPGVLANVSHSTRYMANDLHSHFPLPPDRSPPSETVLNEMRSYIRTTTLAQGLGISDPSDDEISRLLSSLTQTPMPISTSRKYHGDVDEGEVESEGIGHLLALMLSERSLIGWSSHGHSAVDVNIYGAVSPSTHPHALSALRGNRENTDIGLFMAKWLGVDTDGNGGLVTVTQELRQWNGEGWMGDVPVIASDSDPAKKVDLHEDG